MIKISKKLIIADQNKDIGGGQKIYLEIASIALDKNYQINLFFPHGGDLETQVLNQFNKKVKTYDLNIPKIKNAKKTMFDYTLIFIYIFRLLRHYKELKKNDIWYINGGRALPFFLFMRIFIKKKIIFHVHIDHGPFVNKFLATMLKVGFITKIVFASSFLNNQAIKATKAFKNNKKVLIVENALNRKMSKLKFNNRYRYIKNINVVIPGKIIKEKGQDRIIKIAEKFKEISFYFVGSSDISFLTKIKRKCPSNIIFYGKVNDLSDAFKAIQPQISIIPSRWQEPFGLVAIESMAHSCITIGSKIGGLINIAKKTGMILFEDHNELCNILSNLFLMPKSDLVNLAHNQYTKTQKNFSYLRYKTNIENLLKQI